VWGVDGLCLYEVCGCQVMVGSKARSLAAAAARSELKPLPHSHTHLQRHARRHHNDDNDDEEEEEEEEGKVNSICLPTKSFSTSPPPSPLPWESPPLARRHTPR